MKTWEYIYMCSNAYLPIIFLQQYLLIMMELFSRKFRNPHFIFSWYEL